MRTFKLIDHNMFHWQHEYDWKKKIHYDRDPVPGIKVCSTAKLQNIGVITDVKPKVKHQYGDAYYVPQVEVYWLTGPHKGKKEWKDSENVVNFDSYKKAISDHLEEITNYELEAEMQKPCK